MNLLLSFPHLSSFVVLRYGTKAMDTGPPSLGLRKLFDLFIYLFFFLRDIAKIFSIFFTKLISNFSLSVNNCIFSDCRESEKVLSSDSFPS